MLPEEPLILRQVSQACDYVLDLRDERLFELRRERNGCIRRGDPLYRRVEVLEGLLGDRRRDLAAETARMRVLVQDEDLRGLARGLQHRLLVPGNERPQVEDLDRDAVAVELLSRLLGCVNHRAPGDDAEVVALLVDARLAERSLVALVGYLGL